jgi:long-chain acyl-CoA synthetase
MKLAHQYQIRRNLNLWESLPIKLAQKWVFSQWRAIFGGNLKALISGGAALDPQLVNIFTAAGIPLLQGYGLTETSGAVTYTHGIYNDADTVGTPMTGVELAISEDGEVLIKAPFVSDGYYQDPQKTKAIFDDSGWLHTGDLGEITPAGLLKLKGVKKTYFKLSTGKYVSAYPLESQLEQSPLIKRAITLAPNQKFCAMLIFPNLPILAEKAQQMGLNLQMEELLHHSCIIALYQTLIDETNCHLPYWSNVRKFKLIPSLPEGLRDAEAMELFRHEIAVLYDEEAKSEVISPAIAVSCPTIKPYTCPVYAQSLH